MIIGIPKEIKTMENRVSMTPGAVETLVRRGNTVLVEQGAGLGSGLLDEAYEGAGAKMVTAEDAWSAEMVIKVKEPLESEYRFFRDDLTLFTYLHLAAEETLTTAMLESGVTGIAYETVRLPNNTLPLLMPMSEVAGRMATQVGAHYLEKHQGGRGILLGGVPGVSPASVAIIGGGIVGTNAAKIAMGMGAQVTVFDLNHTRLQYLDDVFQGRLITMSSHRAQHPGRSQTRGPGHRLRAGSRRKGPPPGDPGHDFHHEGRRGDRGRGRGTRAVAWRPSRPPPTTTPPTLWTAWCITAWPTCPGAVPPHLDLRPGQPDPCPMPYASRTRGWTPCAPTPGLGHGPQHPSRNN